MTLDAFDGATLAVHHHRPPASRGAFPAGLDAVLSDEACGHAREVIAGWPGYRPTPLRTLDGLAGELGIGALYYKDEGDRFGLGSFKALGGAYAVLRLLASEIPKRTGGDAPDGDIVKGKFAGAAAEITVVTATDGNHGRSVAWGARQFGCRCRIYMHRNVSKGRAEAVEALGATVVWVDGHYDDSVRQAARDADRNGWFVVSDTSWEGYADMPRHVMAGYTLMTAETMAQLPPGVNPTHLFVQGGCGGLAAAVLFHFWRSYGDDCPRFVVVEPDRADCLFQTARNGRLTDVEITEETVMAGLSCGEVSHLGWTILDAGANDFLTITDALVAPAMTLLADGTGGDPPVVAGESAVAGLAALIAARRNPALAEALDLTPSSRVLLLGTEGATDPVIYESIVGRAPEDVAA